MTRMPETPMPKRGGGAAEKSCGCRTTQRIEGPRAIAPGENSPGLKVLHRATSGIKLNRTIIVRGKLAHRYNVLNKVRRNKNIIK